MADWGRSAVSIMRCESISDELPNRQVKAS